MIASTFVVLASALAAAATRSLKVEASAPLVVSNIDDFEVKTTVINTGDEPLKLLKDPRGPLSQWGTNTFRTANQDGSAAEFTGVYVRYVPSQIAKTTQESHFTVLAPGASVEISHEAGRYYNFTAAGAGTWTFDPVNIFHAVETDGSLSSIQAETIAATAHISGNLVSVKGLSAKSVGGKLPAKESELSKRVSYSGCSSTQQSQTSSAVSSGQRLASAAASYMSSHPSGSTLETTWFGTFSSSRASSIQTAYTRLSTYPSGWTYNCNTCADETDTYAYVYPSSYGTVYLCGYFWIAPATGSGSRADTIVHEGSHFTQVKGTQDYTYGESSCKSLAKSSPSQASNNADNLAFFSDYV